MTIKSIKKTFFFVVFKDGMDATDSHTFLTEKQIFSLKYMIFICW